MKVIKMITTIAGPDVAPMNAGTEYTVADEVAHDLYIAKACHKPVDVQIKSVKVDADAFGKLQIRNLQLENDASEHHHSLKKEQKRAEALEDDLNDHKELLELHKNGTIKADFEKLIKERDDLAARVLELDVANSGLVADKVSLQQALEQADKDNSSLKMELAARNASVASESEVRAADAIPPAPTPKKKAP